jgi:hypothetical protein
MPLVRSAPGSDVRALQRPRGVPALSRAPGSASASTWSPTLPGNSRPPVCRAPVAASPNPSTLPGRVTRRPAAKHINRVMKVIDKATCKTASSPSPSPPLFHRRLTPTTRGTHGEKEEVYGRRCSYPKGSDGDRKGSKGLTAAHQEAPGLDGPHTWTESDERAPPLRGTQGQGPSARGSLGKGRATTHQALA